MAQDSVVEVQLFKRRDNTGFIKVRLRSIVQPRIISFKDIELDSVPTKAAMERAVEIVAGALAEYQDQTYGDNHDPSECARVGKEAFQEMWAELEQQGSSSMH